MFVKSDRSLILAPSRAPLAPEEQGLQEETRPHAVMVIQETLHLVSREPALEIQALSRAPQALMEELLLSTAQAHTARVIQASILQTIKELQPGVSDACGDTEELLLLEEALAHTAKVIQVAVDVLVKEHKLLTLDPEGVSKELILEAARVHTAKVIRLSVIQVTRERNLLTRALPSAPLKAKDTRDSDIPPQTAASEDTSDRQLRATAQEFVENIIKCSRELILEEIESAITEKLDQRQAQELTHVHLKTNPDIPARKTQMTSPAISLQQLPLVRYRLLVWLHSLNRRRAHGSQYTDPFSNFHSSWVVVAIRKSEVNYSGYLGVTSLIVHNMSVFPSSPTLFTFSS